MTIVTTMATAITTITAMTTTIDPASLYRLMAWFSPAYPIGAFSYSHGIEYAVEAGFVKTAADLSDWIGEILLHGAGHVDAVLLKAAYESAGDPAALDGLADLAAAWRGTAETALESGQQGGSFLLVTRAAWGHPDLDSFAARRGEATVALSIAIGLAAAAHRLDLKAVLAAYLHAFGANLVSAAVRLIPLGQTDGQRALAALMPVTEAAVTKALATPLEGCGTAVPMVDLCSMQHETQYTRLFRS
ncbi:urease accessory protein UreF [Ferrovibrio xuzhouensis]|uniref:Urease accessory protein UreF n=1 Tax=Ferrovibrio xuzhouensis TaxID=1576914 RepID=A0ABV7VBE8_9PROT